MWLVHFQFLILGYIITVQNAVVSKFFQFLILGYMFGMCT